MCTELLVTLELHPIHGKEERARPQPSVYTYFHHFCFLFQLHWWTRGAFCAGVDAPPHSAKLPAHPQRATPWQPLRPRSAYTGCEVLPWENSSGKRPAQALEVALGIFDQWIPGSWAPWTRSRNRKGTQALGDHIPWPWRFFTPWGGELGWCPLKCRARAGFFLPESVITA